MSSLLLFAVIVSSIFATQAGVGANTGSLTITPVPKTWSKYVGANLYCDSTKLFVRIDRRDWVHWSQKEDVEVSGLDFDKAHLVEVRCEGKPLQATKFRFSDYKSTHVCVPYDVYGGIYLFDYATRGWGCTKAAPKSRLP